MGTLIPIEGGRPPRTGEDVLRGWVLLSAEHLTDGLANVAKRDPLRMHVKGLAEDYRRMAGLAPLGGSV